MTNKKTPSENIKEDQSNLMNTLESIRALLEQNETKLSAARESISIANTNTRNDTSALLNMRSGVQYEQIVPILDDIVELELSTDSLDEIPELDSVFNEAGIEPEFKRHIDDTPLHDAIQRQDSNPEQSPKPTEASASSKPSLAALTAKNLLIDALDNLQLELEESLRETLMKTMVMLEKDLKLKISQRIDAIKTEIDK